MIHVILLDKEISLDGLLVLEGCLYASKKSVSNKFLVFVDGICI